MSDSDILNTLPTEIAYLAEPARKYGVYQFDEKIQQFLDSASESEMNELAALAEKIRINNHHPVVEKWLDEYWKEGLEDMGAANLYFLFLVMDMADLRFD